VLPQSVIIDDNDQPTSGSSQNGIITIAMYSEHYRSTETVVTFGETGGGTDAAVRGVGPQDEAGGVRTGMDPLPALVHASPMPVYLCEPIPLLSDATARGKQLFRDRCVLISGRTVEGCESII